MRPPTRCGVFRRPIGVCAWLAAVCLLVGLGISALAAAQEPRPRNRWWHNETIQKELNLTPDQVEQLDAEFEKDLPARIELRRRIDELDRELKHVIEVGEADDDTVLEMSTEVENLRSERNTRRTRMLLAMYKILTPEERKLLREIQRRRRQPNLN